MLSSFYQKYHLIGKVLPMVGLLIFIKFWLIEAEFVGWELNAYFSALISAGVFLLGFLIAGALPDYKEAEKIPGEMSASLDTITDELVGLWRQKQPSSAKTALQQILILLGILRQWFNKEVSTTDVMKELRVFSDVFVELEPHTQANFLSRLKTELATLRRHVIRVRTIRETTFTQAGYAVAEVFSALVIFSLLMVSHGTLFSALFLTGSIGFLLLYMIALIHDLDNPFHYNQHTHKADEITIEPLMAVERRVKNELKHISKP